MQCYLLDEPRITDKQKNSLMKHSIIQQNITITLGLWIEQDRLIIYTYGYV